jgi:hypothetical protein
MLPAHSRPKLGALSMATPDAPAAPAVPTVPVAPEPPRLMAVRDIGIMMLRHLDIHDGLWDITVEFQAGFGAMGPSPGAMLPGAMFGISKIGIVRAQQQGPLTIDASVANPAA